MANNMSAQGGSAVCGKYFFILGNNPTLSIAEICAVFPSASEKTIINEQIFTLETEDFDAQAMIRRLGGVIKIGKIEGELMVGDFKKMAKGCFEMMYTEKGEGKFKFGISYYGKGKFNIKPLGMEIKNILKEAGQSVRWVISREPVLSSVVVEQNKLVGKGIELVLIPTEEKNKLTVGKTLAVQAFKELSFRDYGRPGRDDLSGMLPPKLAQIMINLSQGKKEELFLDPFCGSGTMLSEAMLMGYGKLAGSDISPKAVKDTETNLKWIMEKFKVPSLLVDVFEFNVTELSKKIGRDSIGAIATEPYLGPQRGKVDSIKIAQELDRLYSGAIREFKKILKPGGRAVMAWPVFTKSGVYLNPDLGGMKTINAIPEELRKDRNIKLTHRHSIVYGREGQKVWREIVVLEK